jgi:hypothetical protein
MFTVIIFLNLILKCRLLSKQRTQKKSKKAVLVYKTEQKGTEEEIHLLISA